MRSIRSRLHSLMISRFGLYVYSNGLDPGSESCSLQQDLDSIVRKSQSWNLKLNIDKCVVMRFGKRSLHNFSMVRYSIDGRELEFVLSCRDLEWLWIVHCMFMLTSSLGRLGL